MNVDKGTNPKQDYDMTGRALDRTKLEKDLGVYISDDLASSKQCEEVEKKCHRILSYIKRQFTYLGKDVVLPLYNSLVRPHLEYAVQAWAPTSQADIRRLERVQERATKLIPSIRHKNYFRRMADLNLFSLCYRRLRGQLIQVFKMLNGLINVDYTKMFTLHRNNTRGNGIKLVGKRCQTALCRNFFSNKIVSEWNNLPHEVLTSTSLGMFKKRLDIWMGPRTREV